MIESEIFNQKTLFLLGWTQVHTRARTQLRLWFETHLIAFAHTCLLLPVSLPFVLSPHPREHLDFSLGQRSEFSVCHSRKYHDNWWHNNMQSIQCMGKRWSWQCLWTSEVSKSTVIDPSALKKAGISPISCSRFLKPTSRSSFICSTTIPVQEVKNKVLHCPFSCYPNKVSDGSFTHPSSA